ncbi:hypothetical protein BESB_073280 [Besnoitia besnoiti]|uniref:Uncharacterized protein n=1 Tax=Besnoitia besnoiti TaxID=94643 RepID=A0A2A9ME01_BESBE|nr:uncharacterized protein BESB_073280 [Besnoitia besnoiti]PFH34176.1 hypothetical protein BESB_073280 [Besnoitia besnoiti]
MFYLWDSLVGASETNFEMKTLYVAVGLSLTRASAYVHADDDAAPVSQSSPRFTSDLTEDAHDAEDGRITRKNSIICKFLRVLRAGGLPAATSNRLEDGDELGPELETVYAAESGLPPSGYGAIKGAVEVAIEAIGPLGAAALSGTI